MRVLLRSLSNLAPNGNNVFALKSLGLFEDILRDGLVKNDLRYTTDVSYVNKDKLS